MTQRNSLFPITLAFRSTEALRQALCALAEQSKRNESDLIREAVWVVIDTFKDTPEKLRRMI